jgi:hypothetical protein
MWLDVIQGLALANRFHGSTDQKKRRFEAFIAPNSPYDLPHPVFSRRHDLRLTKPEHRKKFKFKL